MVDEFDLRLRVVAAEHSEPTWKMGRNGTGPLLSTGTEDEFDEHLVQAFELIPSSLFGGVVVALWSTSCARFGCRASPEPGPVSV
ncbi:hypothetical protein ACWDG9_17150 [Streptomyces sp. NPDC001073]